jgi:hypothetical protein
MQRLDAHKLRFHIGELNGVVPNDFIWEERLLSRIAHGVEFRTKQGDYLRFTTDAGRVYFERFVIAFDTLRYLEPFLERWSENVRKQIVDSAQAWANAAARRVVKESLARESDGR